MTKGGKVHSISTESGGETEKLKPQLFMALVQFERLLEFPIDLTLH